MNIITYTIECEPEQESVVGNAMASGDAAEDDAAERAILAELDAGNRWAWCCVRVIATLDGTRLFGASGWLVGCSYASERSFREPGGYFDGLCVEARDALIAEINAIGAALGA